MESFCTGIGYGDFATDKFPVASFANRCRRITERRYVGFEKCGFYDPKYRNGGPDTEANYKKKPEHPINNHEYSHLWWDGGLFAFFDRVHLSHQIEFTETGGRLYRKRRSDDCSDWNGNSDGIKYFQWSDAYEGEGSFRVQIDEPCAADYIHPEWLDESYLDLLKEEDAVDCIEECEDSGADNCTAKCSNDGLRNENPSRTRRINNKGPYGALKTVMSGLRKWGERYLAECPGQMTGVHMLRRNGFIARAMYHFFTADKCTDSKCIEWSDRIQKGEKFTAKQMKRLWGRKNIEMKKPNIYN